MKYRNNKKPVSGIFFHPPVLSGASAAASTNLGEERGPNRENGEYLPELKLSEFFM
jgi:hypothetical protein